MAKPTRPKSRPAGLVEAADDAAAAGAIARGLAAQEREVQDQIMQESAAKKRAPVKKKATGGVVRGMGAAKRGGKFTRSA